MINPTVTEATITQKNSMKQRVSYIALFLFSFCLIFLFLFIEVKQAYGRGFTEQVEQRPAQRESTHFVEAEIMYGYDYSTRQAMPVP